MKVRHNTYVSRLIMVENPNEGHTAKFGHNNTLVISIFWIADIKRFRFKFTN